MWYKAEECYNIFNLRIWQACKQLQQSSHPGVHLWLAPASTLSTPLTIPLATKPSVAIQSQLHAGKKSSITQFHPVHMHALVFLGNLD